MMSEISEAVCTLCGCQARNDRSVLYKCPSCSERWHVLHAPQAEIDAEAEVTDEMRLAAAQQMTGAQKPSESSLVKAGFIVQAALQVRAKKGAK